MDNFLGEIRLFSWTVIPKYWLPCDGRLLPIQTYAALYSLLGVQYGGDGKTTFGLPDLRGRVAVGANYTPAAGTVRTPGQTGGAEAVMLPASALITHGHSVQVSNATLNNGGPQGRYPATNANANATPVQPTYVTADETKLVALNANTVGTTTQTPVPNMQPSLCLSYCIATQGAYPMRQY